MKYIRTFTVGHINSYILEAIPAHPLFSCYMFVDLFESKLEEFCKSKGVSQVEFLKRCREASTDDDKSNLYMNILLSSVEYETFVKLMYIMKPVAERRLAMESEAKAMEDRYVSLDIKGGAGADTKGATGAKGEPGEEDVELDDMAGRAEAKSASRFEEEGGKSSK